MHRIQGLAYIYKCDNILLNWFRLKFYSVIGTAPKVPTSVVDMKESFTYVDDVVQVTL